MKLKGAHLAIGKTVARTLNGLPDLVHQLEDAERPHFIDALGIACWALRAR